MCVVLATEFMVICYSTNTKLMKLYGIDFPAWGAPSPSVVAVLDFLLLLVLSTRVPVTCMLVTLDLSYRPYAFYSSLYIFQILNSSFPSYFVLCNTCFLFWNFYFHFNDFFPLRLPRRFSQRGNFLDCEFVGDFGVHTRASSPLGSWFLLALCKLATARTCHCFLGFPPPLPHSAPVRSQWLLAARTATLENMHLSASFAWLNRR